MRAEKHLILIGKQISCEFTWTRSKWNSLDFGGMKRGLSSSLSLTKIMGFSIKSGPLEDLLKKTPALLFLDFVYPWNFNLKVF